MRMAVRGGSVLRVCGSIQAEAGWPPVKDAKDRVPKGSRKSICQWVSFLWNGSWGEEEEATCQGTGLVQEPCTCGTGFGEVGACRERGHSRGGLSARPAPRDILPSHWQLHKGKSRTQIRTPGSTGFQLAFVPSPVLSQRLTWGAQGRDTVNSPGVFSRSFSSVQVPSFTLIGWQLPHCFLTCWKITSAPSAPPFLPHPSCSKTTEYFPGWVFLPASSQLPIVPDLRPRALSGLCPDFISHADLCGSPLSLTLSSLLC